MKKIIIPLLVLLSSCFCKDPKEIKKPITPNHKKEKIVYILPLGNVKSEYLDIVKNSVETFYGFKCILKHESPLTKDLLASSKTKYEAGKILAKFKTTENVLIVTEKDIACRKNQYPEWGILGLGYRPGTTCVVSTFRMKHNVSEKTTIDRLKKVALHEVGHNLGLDHCNFNVNCMMNDAKGTIRQVDREKIWLCEKCKKQINL